MPANKVSHAQTAPIALNQVFAHHSAKRWNGKEIRPVPSLPRRTLPERLEDGFKRFAGRVANALTPDHVRVKYKARDSLKEVDHAMGRLLGGLLLGATDPEPLARDLHGFIGSRGYLTEQRGVDPSKLFDIRARVHLAHLTPGELNTLAKNLGQAIVGSANEAHGYSLKVLNHLVHRERAARAMLSAFKAAQQAAPQGPQAVKYHFDSALGAAGNLLKALGVPDDGTPLAKSHRHALVKEVLNDFVAKGLMSQEAVRALADALPSELQSALFEADHPQRFHPDGPVNEILKQSIARRWTDLDADVRGQMALVSTLEPSNDLPRFADALTLLATQWNALKAHCAAHGLPMDGALAKAVGALSDTLKERLDPDRLPAQIQRLGAAQLLAYSSALTSLKLRGPYVDQLVARIDEVKKDSLKAPSNALRQAYRELSEGHLSKALTWFLQANEWAEEARNLQLKLGQSHWAGQEGHTAFMAHLIEHALTVDDSSTQTELYDRLNNKETLALAGVLQQIGIGQALELNNPRGEVIQSTGKFIEVMHTAIADKLGKTAQERKTLTDAQAEQPTLCLSPQACEAVYAFSGTKVFPSGNFGVVSDQCQTRFQRKLDAMLATPAVAHTSRRTLHHTGVTEAMWKDLTRATYATVDMWGKVDTVVGPHNQLPADSPKLDIVVDRVRDDLGLNASELLELSQVANQNLWAGLEEAMQSPDSPVRLPDGTPGYIMGRASDTFTLRRDPAGHLIVRCEHELRDVNAFVDLRSEAQAPVGLDATQSHAWFCIELEIGKDRRVRVSQPLTSSYTLVPAGA